MRISKQSWLYRWAYFFCERWKKPDQVNLCNFFWRVVLLIPLVWAGIAAVIAIVLAVLFVLPIMEFGWVVGIFVAPSLIGAIAAGSYLCSRMHNRKPVVPLFIREYIKAKKERFCPIIEVVD